MCTYILSYLLAFFNENKNCIGFNLFDISFGVLYCFIIKSNPVMVVGLFYTLPSIREKCIKESTDHESRNTFQTTFFSIVLPFDLDGTFLLVSLNIIFKYVHILIRNLLLETGNGNAKGKSLGKQTNHRTCARWETKHFKTCLDKSVETRGRFPY